MVHLFVHTRYCIDTIFEAHASKKEAPIKTLINGFVNVLLLPET